MHVDECAAIGRVAAEWAPAPFRRAGRVSAGPRCLVAAAVGGLGGGTRHLRALEEGRLHARRRKRLGFCRFVGSLAWRVRNPQKEPQNKRKAITINKTARR